MAEETTSRQSKNNVFVDFFRDKKNIYRLYSELHPEDTDVQLDDIGMVTLDSVLVNTLYNDLGFSVKDRYIILVEAQSVWCPNIALRMLFYLSETYRRYLKETKQSEHSSRKVKLPKPDLYVVYSGGDDVANEISLNEDFFGDDSPIDVRVKVFHSVNETLCGQYVGFCRVFDEQKKIYHGGVECAKATIRICTERGYLSDYLKSREKEAITMLAELFDEEYLREQYNIAEGVYKFNEGMEKGIVKVAVNMLRSGILSKENVADMTGLPIERVNELAAAQGI